MMENMVSRLFFSGLANKCCYISWWGPWIHPCPAQSWACTTEQLLRSAFGWVQLSWHPALAVLISHRCSALIQNWAYRHQSPEVGVHEGLSVRLLWAWVIRDWEKIPGPGITHVKIPTGNYLARLCDYALVGLIPSSPIFSCCFSNSSLGGEPKVRMGVLHGQGHCTDMALGVSHLGAKPLPLYERPLESPSPWMK